MICFIAIVTRFFADICPFQPSSTHFCLFLMQSSPIVFSSIIGVKRCSWRFTQSIAYFCLVRKCISRIQLTAASLLTLYSLFQILIDYVAAKECHIAVDTISCLSTIAAALPNTFLIAPLS